MEYLYSFTFHKQVQDAYGKPLIASGCFSAYQTRVLCELGGWSSRTLAEDMDLTITPSIADQELNLGIRYWEGATNVAGTAGGRAISGVGYVELTGYTAMTRAPSL